MIKANELRFGIWFKNRGVRKNAINKFHEIGKEGFISFGHRGVDWLNDEFEPIPLTPEILEKCGFVIDFSLRRTNAILEDKNNRLLVCFFKNGRIDIVLNGNKSRSIFTKKYPKFYLHQLQNLYFDLTATELEIKL